MLDDDGESVHGQVVNFRVTAGRGSVFAGVAVTDADGYARERWTLGTVAGESLRLRSRPANPVLQFSKLFCV